MNKYFCSACGAEIADTVHWPRHCNACGREHYRNPIPVAVVMVPVDGGILTVRRAIPPGIGKLALPGGFINDGETWQEGGAREVLEETGLTIAPGDLSLLDAVSVEAGNLLLFCLAPPQTPSGYVANSEVLEVVIVREPTELAFSSHTDQLKRHFNR
jgi:NADH pyrophosphatase NudC (nudix superfamily)